MATLAGILPSAQARAMESMFEPRPEIRIPIRRSAGAAPEVMSIPVPRAAQAPAMKRLFAK
jgi:hypothetical protein